MPATTPVPTPSVTPVGSVPDGKVADFLTGKFVNDTPEEYVRQNIEKALVRQYKYAPGDCVPEFPIKVGSARKRVDIVVFGKGDAHTQANAYILIETKRADVKPTHRTEGVGQLQSYMASCLNAQYGMWTNGTERFIFARRPAAACGGTPGRNRSVRSIGRSAPPTAVQLHGRVTPGGVSRARERQWARGVASAGTTK